MTQRPYYSLVYYDTAELVSAIISNHRRWMKTKWFYTDLSILILKYFSILMGVFFCRNAHPKEIAKKYINIIIEIGNLTYSLMNIEYNIICWNEWVTIFRVRTMYTMYNIIMMTDQKYVAKNTALYNAIGEYRIISFSPLFVSACTENDTIYTV